MGWTKLITNNKILEGIPKDIQKKLRVHAEMKGKQGWLLTLDMPIYLSIMTHCNSQFLREEVYRAHITRASDQGKNPNIWDNSQIMNEILTLRYEEAQLLGFKNYACKSLATKMARDPNQVLNFLNKIAKISRSQGEKELNQLLAFTKKHYGVDSLKPWDFMWYSEKQKQHLYKIDEEQIRPYFPENKTIKGLFKLVNRIYGINVKERYDIDVWHPDVRFFEIYDEKNEIRGGFYLDLYSRENKRDGAWMDNCMSRMRKADGSLQKPVAYLTFNFKGSIENSPSLFSHDEMITLFHEFGHGLHHILTDIEIPEISGTNGVPWDVVEFPSQIMEKWCWEPDVLAFISCHYKTGNSLPENLINRILEMKKYQSAMFILRQVELSLFDFRLHAEFDPKEKDQILRIFREIKEQISVISSTSWDRFPHSFRHIFSGGYAAGYYSYLWSDVLASDAYSRFKKEGIFNRRTGLSFLENILTRGGCEDPTKLFKRFRGRKPKIDAMLKNYGIQILKT